MRSGLAQWSWIAITCFLWSVSGCSSGDAVGGKRVPVMKVTGKVTMHGSPLVGATVTFSPRGSQPTAVGVTNDAGEFKLSTYGGGDGAAEGEYAVLVTKHIAMEEAAPSEAHSSDPYAVGPTTAHSTKPGSGSANVVPAAYADPAKTPLSAKVDASNRHFEFEVK